MSVSWSTGLPVTDPAPGALILRRVARWIRRWFYRGEHGRPLALSVTLPSMEPGSYAKAPELPWWTEFDPATAETERIWPELDLLSVERFIDRLFAPLEAAR